MARLNPRDVPCLSCQAKYGKPHACDMPDYCPCDQLELHRPPTSVEIFDEAMEKMRKGVPSRFSKAALEKQYRLAEKQARGEQPTWADLVGILEANPDLPDCQKYYDEVEQDIQCQKPNHHDGKHRAVVEW